MSELIELLIRLFLLGFIGYGTPVVTAPAQSVPPPPFEATIPAPADSGNGTLTPEGEFVVSGIQHVVESVDPLLLESFPVQIHLHVTGYQPDGCDYPVEIVQRREGNTVYVRIFRQVPIDVMCPMNIIGYDETIPLEGGFETGTYTIDVNGVIVEVSI